MKPAKRMLDGSRQHVLMVHEVVYTSSRWGCFKGPPTDLECGLLCVFLSVFMWGLYSLTSLLSECSSFRSSLISVISVTFSCRKMSFSQSDQRKNNWMSWAFTGDFSEWRSNQCPLFYLHELGIGFFMLLSRFVQLHLQAAYSLLQVITVATEQHLNILIHCVFIHLSNSTRTLIYPLHLSVYDD